MTVNPTSNSTTDTKTKANNLNMPSRSGIKRRKKSATDKPFLVGKDLVKVYGMGRRATRAVDGVNIAFHRGEVLSIVGESGSGKTTLAKLILGLTPITEGQILVNGEERAFRTRKQKRAYWKMVQAIFQDPFSSYNVFNKVDQVLLDCIKLSGQGHLSDEEKTQIMTEACSFVNLQFSELTNKYPFELSGGQMQRLMISRIFILKPRLLIADEPTSMVDACSRATILDMLMKLRDETNMTICFITHDIGLAYYVSDRVFIMQKGVFVEEGDPDDVILNPQHEYTQRLLSDVPSIYDPWEFDFS